VAQFQPELSVWHFSDGEKTVTLPSAQCLLISGGRLPGFVAFLLIIFLLRQSGNFSIDGIILRGEKRSARRKTCQSATFSTTNPTRTVPRWSPVILIFKIVN
jgi:hypothetical protein